MDGNKMTNEERYSKIQELIEALRVGIMTLEKLEALGLTIEESASDEYYPDYFQDCSMCGKPMQHRGCGMCTKCEQVWNG